MEGKGEKMEQVRIGVIGIGNMGTSHSKWLAAGQIAGAKLAAVCDIDPERKEWAAENLPKEVSFFDTYQELLKSKSVDAVVIAVPHYLHPEIAIAAMKENLHVMVEKPAGVYTKQIRQMNEEAAKRPDLVFGMMFNQRMNPLYQRVKALLDAGTVGNIRRVHWMITSWWRTQKYYDSSAWRATWSGEGGGVLVNQAPHQLDLLQWMCGMPVKMCAHLKYGSHRNITVEDDVTAYFEYENGASGTLITCTHDALGTDHFEVYGEKGKIIIENSSKVIVKRLVKPESVLSEELSFREAMALTKGQGSQKLYEEEVFECPENWEKQHIDVLINFTNSILHGETLIAPGCEGIRAVEIANAMYLSDWQQKEITLPIEEDVFCEELKKRISEERNGEKLQR